MFIAVLAIPLDITYRLLIILQIKPIRQHLVSSHIAVGKQGTQLALLLELEAKYFAFLQDRILYFQESVILDGVI